VRHVLELVDLPPVAPLETGVELRVAAQAGYFVTIDWYGTPGPPAPRSDMS